MSRQAEPNVNDESSPLDTTELEDSSDHETAPHGYLRAYLLGNLAALVGVSGITYAIYHAVNWVAAAYFGVLGDRFVVGPDPVCWLAPAFTAAITLYLQLNKRIMRWLSGELHDDMVAYYDSQHHVDSELMGRHMVQACASLSLASIMVLLHVRTGFTDNTLYAGVLIPPGERRYDYISLKRIVRYTRPGTVYYILDFGRQGMWGTTTYDEQRLPSSLRDAIDFVSERTRIPIETIQQTGK